jgi:enediyne biosynthesis protein E4
VRERVGGGSLLSASDGRIQFGLGASRLIDVVDVRWPSGRIDRYNGLVVDGAYLLREGRSEASPLPGWKR